MTKYWILIRFQGHEYRTLETFNSVNEAYDEAHRRFDGTPVQFDVFSEDSVPA